MDQDFPTFTKNRVQLMQELYGLLDPVKPSDPAGVYLRGMGIAAHRALRTLSIQGLPLEVPNFDAAAAIVAPVVNPAGEICGLGGRWLDERGRQAGGYPGNIFWFSLRGGSAVRFGLPDNHLALTVDIETGLRVSSRFAMPCWCSVVPWFLEDIAVPESVENVIIYGENDAMSVACIERAKAWLERQGRTVDIESTWGLLQ